MPNKANAKKALRQNKSHAKKNLAAKIEVKTLIKNIKKALSAEDSAKAMELATLAGKKLDKVAKKNYFHKNKASRIKSRIAKKINSTKKS